MNDRRRIGVFGITSLACLCAIGVAGAREQAPSSSLMARPGVARAEAVVKMAAEEPHALRQISMFAVAPPKPRTFHKHDLIQIIVREQSQARSTHELDTEKDYRLDGRIARWPRFDLTDLLQLQLQAGRTTDMPELRMSFKKEFSGDGDYRRRDDFSARITAEVIEVLPNGNMIVEARTRIKTDKEEQVMIVTGVCRPQDVTAANTILSNQIHNLVIEKMHDGELRRATERGIIAQVLDFVFAF